MKLGDLKKNAYDGWFKILHHAVLHTGCVLVELSGIIFG